MSKHYFTEAYLHFFMALAPNNHKEWFDQNRSAYQSDVKAPFEAFVTDLISALKQEDDLGALTASECIFRINKDVRFSKDKTPYKLQMSALITKGGRKQMQHAGLYIEIGPEFLSIYSGFYMPEKPQLLSIRQKIASNPAEFAKIIGMKDFRKSFGEVQGEKSKLLPPDLKAAAQLQPLIYNKQYYLLHKSDAGIILKPGLLNYVLVHYRAARPFNRFLSE